MRERLKELICEVIQTDECVSHCNHPYCGECERLADHLLANGVIVPPCKVGDTVYYFTGIHGRRIVGEATVEEIYFSESDFSFLVSTKYTSFVLQQHEVHFTREEAEKALREAEG